MTIMGQRLEKQNKLLGYFSVPPTSVNEEREIAEALEQGILEQYA